MTLKFWDLFLKTMQRNNNCAMCNLYSMLQIDQSFKFSQYAEKQQQTNLKWSDKLLGMITVSYILFCHTLVT